MAGGKHLRVDPKPPRTRRVVGGVIVVALIAVAAVAVVSLIGDGSSADVATEAIDPTAAESATVPPTTGTTTTTRGPRGSGEAVTIVFAGDSFVEGVLRDRLDQRPDDFVGPYADVFARADLAVLNLEAALTDGGAAIGKQYTFRAPVRVLDALVAGGIDVVSVANNHGLDYGPSGLVDTIAAKRATGMVVGAGEDEDEAYAPFLVEIKGQRIGVLGVTQVLDGDLISAWTATPTQAGLASAKRVDRLVEEIERIRPDVDTIAVMVHWGIETHECPTEVQHDLAVTLEAAGADIIVGGHQHRVAGGGMLDTAAVHYGLGNFLFSAQSDAARRTGVFSVTIAGQDVESYEWIPGRITDSVPEPLVGDAAASELAAWEQQRGCTNLDG